ncbi:MAG: DUF1800 domain-containing protein, partial [Variovorax sp.]
MFHIRHWLAAFSVAAASLLAGCALGPSPAPTDPVARLRWLDRLTWGANASAERQLAQQGDGAWLQAQLHPKPAALPPAAQAQIDAMTITRTPVDQLVVALDAQRKAA